MKKSFLIISTVCTMLFSSNLLASDSGKFDRFDRETYEEYQARKKFIEENITGKFTGTAGINSGTLTFSQAHIECTKRESLTGNNSFGGDMEASAYNACMANYAPFLDSSEGVGSCGSDRIEWGDFGTGANCYADVSDLEDGQSFLFENENSADAYQGFAKITCNSGTLEIIDSKCDLVPDPCLAGDTIGHPDRLPARYKENDNWRSSHLWPITEPMWARPDSGSYVIPQDPRGIDRSQQFKDKVASGDREDYCYATISPMNPGSAGATFPMQSGDLVVNPDLDNSDAYFDNDRSNGVWRCFDGEFYNEGSNCQYEVQSCDATTVNVSNGAGQFCQFNLPFQQHNSVFTSRDPSPENSIGSVKAFCWDGNWEIWEESCNLSCNNSFSDNSWLSNDGDPEQCRHSAKNYPSRTAPTSVVTINNENNKMEGNVSYTCNNGTWNVSNEVCKPKECNTLSANTWVVDGAVCNHKTLEYVTPHNETVKTSANNPSNENVGVITYQCRYGNFVDITNYSGNPEFAPTITGFMPNDKNCVETSIPQCYYDTEQTQPSGDPSIFIDEGDGCYIECTQNPITGDQNCTKFCTAGGVSNPNKDCFFPSGYTSCQPKGWYPNGDTIHCPQWKLNPQVCNSGVWEDQAIPEKNWASKAVTAFTEALTHRNYIQQNVRPTVTVNFGRVFNINTGTNAIGYGNGDGAPLLDKAVQSNNSSVNSCTTRSENVYGVSDTSNICFTSAQQSNVKDWQIFYDGGSQCTLSGVQSGEWTTNNISITCSQTTDKPANANAVFVIRYNDGKTLTSPKISITASISIPATPAGYCGTYALVENIPSGQSGTACNNSIVLTSAIQSGDREEILQRNYVYESGVCYEVEYTGSLMCIDDDPTPTNEALALEGSLSCVSTPVAAFNCGVSEIPEWRTSEISTISTGTDNSTAQHIPRLSIPVPNNSGEAYSATSNYIEVYDQAIKDCNGAQNSCTAELAVVSGNEIEAWLVDYAVVNSGSCTFRNNNNTANIQEGVWYTTNGGLFECTSATAGGVSADVGLKFRLKDGTVVTGKTISIRP